MDDDTSTAKADKHPEESSASRSSTHWSVVLGAGKGDQEAFGKLYTAYLPPLLAYLRYRGNSPDCALDLLHGFFEHLLENNRISTVQQTGKFRSWLLRSLNHFVRDQWAKGQALKRGGDQTHLPIGADIEEGETEPLDPRLTPEQAYDRKWAITLLKRALSKLAAEYTLTAKQEFFNELKDFLPGGQAASSYDDVGKRLGGMGPNAVAVAVKRLRERYSEVLWAEISDTVDPDRVEEEWHHLRQAVSGFPIATGSESKA